MVLICPCPWSQTIRDFIQIFSWYQQRNASFCSLILSTLRRLCDAKHWLLRQNLVKITNLPPDAHLESPSLPKLELLMENLEFEKKLQFLMMENLEIRFDHPQWPPKLELLADNLCTTGLVTSNHPFPNFPENWNLSQRTITLRRLRCTPEG